MQLIWLRSDLRVSDNTALAAACEQGPTLAVWLVSAQQWRSHDDAPCKIDFWLRNLAALSEHLATFHIPLLAREADTWDRAPDVLQKNIHNPVSFGQLFATTDYPQPIVDLRSSRQRALSAFKHLPTRQYEESALEQR